MQVGQQFAANGEDLVDGKLERLLHVAVDPQLEVGGRHHAAPHVRIEPEAGRRTEMETLAGR
jgi:hypothetical protein